MKNFIDYETYHLHNTLTHWTFHVIGCHSDELVCRYSCGRTWMWHVLYCIITICGFSTADRWNKSYVFHVMNTIDSRYSVYMLRHYIILTCAYCNYSFFFFLLMYDWLIDWLIIVSFHIHTDSIILILDMHLSLSMYTVYLSTLIHTYIVIPLCIIIHTIPYDAQRCHTFQ